MKGVWICSSSGNGHGTHCAGTAAGETYGVAKCAKVHAIKVLSDGGSGSTSGIIAAIDWILTLGSQYRPGVVSMSLGGSYNSAFNEAVDRLVDNGTTRQSAVGRAPFLHTTAKEANPFKDAYLCSIYHPTYAGIPAVVAAGNSADDACLYSPASSVKAITVGSTDSSDGRSSFSNRGSCVDIYAPGSFIKSAYYRTDSDFATLSGTSMAAPHVSGAVALVYEANPSFTPDEVKEEVRK